MKDLKKKELLEQLSQEKAKLHSMQRQHRVNPLRNTSLLKKSRRTVARLETFLSVKKNDN